MTVRRSRHGADAQLLKKDPSTMIRTASDTLRRLVVITVIVIGTRQTPVAQDPATASSSDAVPPTTRFPHDGSSPWWISGQINLIEQSHDGFPAQYTGPHSFLATPERTTSRVLTLYTGVRLGHGWEAFMDIESAAGRGLS